MPNKKLKELEHFSEHIIISTPLGQEDDSGLDEILVISVTLREANTSTHESLISRSGPWRLFFEGTLTVIFDKKQERARIPS